MGGRINGPYNRGEYKPQFYVILSKREEIKEVLLDILPYMGDRRSKRIREMLQEMKDNPRRKNGMRKGFNRHTYTPDNYVMELF